MNGNEFDMLHHSRRTSTVEEDRLVTRAMAEFLHQGRWNLDRGEVIAEGLKAAGFTADEITRLQTRAIELARAML